MRQRGALLILTFSIAALFFSCKQGRYLKQLVRETGDPPSVEWHRTSPGGASSFVQNEDGSYIVAGMRTYSNTSDSLFLLKVDKNGYFIQLKNIKQERPYSEISPIISKTTDGGYLVSIGYGRNTLYPNSHILKFDSLGELSWMQKFSGNLWFVYQYDNNTYHIVYSNERMNHFLSIDNRGETIEISNYEDSILCFVNSSCRAFDNCYITVGGYVDHSGYDNNLSYVRKINKKGKIIWTSDIGDSTYWYDIYHNSVQQTADSGFIVVGYRIPYDVSFETEVIKLDKFGNEIWRRHYGDGQWYYYGYSARALRNGHTVILGTVESIHSRYFFVPGFLEQPLAQLGFKFSLASKIMKTLGIGYFNDIILFEIDQEGNEIWSKRFGRIASCDLHTVHCCTVSPKIAEKFSIGIDEDDNMLIVGYSISMIDYPKDCFHIFKLSEEP